MSFEILVFDNCRTRKIQTRTKVEAVVSGRIHISSLSGWGEGRRSWNATSSSGNPVVVQCAPEALRLAGFDLSGGNTAACRLILFFTGDLHYEVYCMVISTDECS